MHEPCLLVQHTAISDRNSATNVRMAQGPLRKKMAHTNWANELNKGIIYTDLERVQRTQQGRRVSHSQEPQAGSVKGRD